MSLLTRAKKAFAAHVAGPLDRMYARIDEDLLGDNSPVLPEGTSIGSIAAPVVGSDTASIAVQRAKRPRRRHTIWHHAA